MMGAKSRGRRPNSSHERFFGMGEPTLSAKLKGCCKSNRLLMTPTAVLAAAGAAVPAAARLQLSIGGSAARRSLVSTGS